MQGLVEAFNNLGPFEMWESQRCFQCSKGRCKSFRVPVTSIGMFGVSVAGSHSTGPSCEGESCPTRSLQSTILTAAHIECKNHRIRGEKEAQEGMPFGSSFSSLVTCGFHGQLDPLLTPHLQRTI